MRREEAGIERDRSFFAANPTRRTYCRIADELEEMELRRGLTRAGWPLVAVRRISEGCRMRRLHVVPALEERELVLPTHEAECALIFETELLRLERVGKALLWVEGAPGRPHRETLEAYHALRERLGG